LRWTSSTHHDPRTGRARLACTPTRRVRPTPRRHTDFELALALSPIPGFGVGDALASATIYALAPTRMAVYDRRAQAGLELLGLALAPKPGRYGRYMVLVEQLIGETTQSGTELSSREIDLGLFTLGGPTS